MQVERLRERTQTLRSNAVTGQLYRPNYRRRGRMTEFYFGTTAHVLRVSLRSIEPEAWRLVVVEQRNPKTKYPVVLDGARACRPEDVGVPGSYEELLRALGNQKHKDHEHMRGWAPVGFDPAAFDLVAANRRLRAK